MTDLQMYRGDTPSWVIACTEEESGAIVDLTGATVKFTARKTLAGPAVITKSTTTTGIVITDAANGLCKLSLLAGDTAGFGPYDTKLVFDLEVTEANGNKGTAAVGTLLVQADVTP